MRSLYERGKSSDEIRQMFRVVDWMMDLPPALELQFKAVLEQIEVEKKMPYVTSVERLAKEEGREEGRDAGATAEKSGLAQARVDTRPRFA